MYNDELSDTIDIEPSYQKPLSIKISTFTANSDDLSDNEYIPSVEVC